MKRIALLVTMTALCAFLLAGIDEYYSFNAITGTYTPITGTPISTILSDDSLSDAITIGFNFPFGDQNFTEIRVSSNGWVGLGNTLTNSNLSNQLSSADWFPVLAPLWDDTSLAGGDCQYLLEGTTPNRVLTIQYTSLKWNYSADNQFNMQVKMHENGKVAFHYGPSTGTPSGASASIGINMAPGGTNWFYSVTPGTPSLVSQTMENANVTQFPGDGVVLEFLPVVPTANDLAATSITGNPTPSVGTPTTYTVTVRNRGTNPQSAYSVKLVNAAGTELASVPGTTIQPGITQTFNISWTPAAEGPMLLRGKVVMAGDGNPNNDLTQPISISVMPAGIMVMTIGAGNEQNRVPVDMWWRNSLYETIYYPTEIGLVGNIAAIAFYNNFITDLPNKPTKIWLGTTQNQDLAAGWIPSTQLTLVFDGTVNYPTGQNTIMVPLQTVFTYTGGNLVMMVNRPMDTTYFNSSDNFFCQTIGTTRARRVQSDSTEYDPANPPADATVSGQFPKTSLYMTPLGTDPLAIINPSSANFGQVLMNTTHTRPFAVMNGGGGTLGVSSITISGSPYFTFQTAPAVPANLVTGQSVPFTVVYAPTTPGNHTGTVTVTDNQGRTVHTIPLSGNSLDPTIYTLPMQQNFDGATAPALPPDWSSIVQSTSTSAYVRTYASSNFSPPNSVAMANGGDEAAVAMLIAPPYVNTIQTNTTRLHFQGATTGGAGSLSVGIMQNPQDAATFTAIQTITLTPTWQEYVVNFATYAGTGRNVAIKLDNTVLWQTALIDNFMLEYIPQNDLAALAVTGNTTPSAGNATTYTANIYNWGSNPQSTYTVKLLDANDVELASAPGVTAAPGATVQIPLVWTPSTEGPVQIHARVYLTGDQNPLNDAGPGYQITVMPAGMMVVTIGAGDELGRIPVDMFYRNSLYETLYYPNEIGIFGNITAISIYNDFSTNLPNKPTRIWLGSTQAASLSAGWIPSTQLTLVYDGTVNYPSGQNTITIPLQTPFTYVGGNLVLMMNRPMDTTYFSSMDRFQCQTVGTDRARNTYSDWDDYQPANPPDGAMLSGTFPKTTLHMTPLSQDPTFVAFPTSKNYGQVLLNTTHSQNFMVMNAGGGTLTVNTINIAGSPFFAIPNMPALPASLTTGQAITFTAVYHPTAVGDHTATITVNDNLRSSIANARAARDREPHTIALSGSCIDPTITALPYLQTFDAVAAPALPVQWSTLINGITGMPIGTAGDDPYTLPNNVYLSNAGVDTATLILIAPPYANAIATNTTRVKFFGRSFDQASVIVGVMTDPQNAATFTEVQSIPLTSTWQEYVVTFGAYAGTGKYVAFKHGLGGTWRTVSLDNVMLEVIPQNDLAAVAVTGNLTPTVGTPANYLVSVFNWGSNPQSTYQVKLYKQGDIEVASVAGLQANPGQTVQVPIAWTPTAEGQTFIYAKVLLTGDQNNLNDQTSNLNLNVQPAGTMFLTIGDGSSLGRIPLDMYYMNSLFECLFYPAEMGNVIGSIYGIGFYPSFVSDLPNMPTNIWIGTTTQPDLSAGWIPSTQLTQVFSGTVNYPTGESLVNIPFSTPYLYLNGENLVLLVERPMDTQYYSSQDRFHCQGGVPNRARNVYSDGTDFDPAAPPDAQSSDMFPTTSIFIIPGGVGHLTGTVLGAGNQPLAGVAIQSTTGGYTATTDAAGHYQIQNIIAGAYTFNFSRYGYINQSQNVTIPEDETVTLNINLQQMPVVTVTGTILGSDTNAGLNGAGIFMTGYDDYTSSTNAAGAFSIPGVYANQSYYYTVICPGYQNASGTINVGAGNYSFGNIILNEVAYAPRQVHGEIAGNNTRVDLTWLAPDPNALDVIESFEAETFPPQNWTQTITNPGPPNTNGVYPTWCRSGAITISGQPVTPTDGSYQAGLWWSYEHQDEWLITPGFNCPPAAYLRFWSYVFLGSTNGDHYYVKLSPDNGATWTTLWDASAQTGGWNYYASPITIDLSMYEGLQLKLAWHADDPPSNDGMWYVWFIDDIYVGNAVERVRFQPGDYVSISTSPRRYAQKYDLSMPNRAQKALFATTPSGPASLSTTSIPGGRHLDRSLTGYRVYRLQPGQENNESAWTQLNTELVTGLAYSDTGWGALPNATYRWAVKAVYTAGVNSVPVFSNSIQKQEVNGYISGVVRSVSSAPISGATVTAGTHTVTTNTSGAYSMLVPVGTYSVTASRTGYVSHTEQDVVVSENQTTTVNFYLEPGSDANDPAIPVARTELSGNMPNPFNPETTIAFALKTPEHVRLEIFNVRGQVVRVLVDAALPTGHHRVVWNGRDDKGLPVSSGVYYYRMRAASYIGTRKMLLME